MKVGMVEALYCDVRYWPLADIPSCTALSAFEGKADMTFCGANVCF
jgi:hypothetical protein